MANMKKVTDEPKSFFHKKSQLVQLKSQLALMIQRIKISINETIH